MSPGESYIWNCQSTEWAFQCGQWELIWNSLLIERYKEMSPGESYNQSELIWNIQLIVRYREMSPGESYGKLDLIWNSELIGRYKEMSPGESYIWNWQSSEWTLCFSMQSMRAHLKQSTNRKI